MTTFTQSRSSPTLYRVCWASVVGTGYGQGRPLPRDVAEFMAHDEGLADPLRTYWVEKCPAGLEIGMHVKRSVG